MTTGRILFAVQIQNLTLDVIQDEYWLGCGFVAERVAPESYRERVAFLVLIVSDVLVVRRSKNRRSAISTSQGRTLHFEDEGFALRSGGVMVHILSFSCDPILLMTRELLLRQLGHNVTSVEGSARALEACESGQRYDLLILDHSISHEDKVAIMAKVKDTFNCPVLALLLPNESRLPGAERSIDSFEPKLFMEAVREMVSLYLLRDKIA